MSIQDFATLFLLTFVAFILLCILQGLKPARRRPEVPTVRVIVRRRWHVEHVPLATRLSEDAFYQGCYRSLLAELDKEAKDNL